MISRNTKLLLNFKKDSTWILILYILHPKDILKSLIFFRGFAIFFIVLGHCLGFGQQLNSSISSDILKNRYAHLIGYEEMIVCGGTAFFVFISGFLFYNVFYIRGFDYKKFIKGKIKNVFSPYLIMVFFLYMAASFNGTKFENSSVIIHNLFFAGAFWYIPFIMTVFICSPIYLKFIETTKKKQMIILAICLIYSISTTRHDHNPVLSMMFWSIFYLFGIFIAKNYEKFKLLIKKDCTCYCIALLAFLTFVIAWRFDNRFLINGGTWDFRITPNLSVAIKIAFCSFFLYASLCLEGSNNIFLSVIKIFLSVLAKYSFSIYFFHIIIFYYLWSNRLIFENFCVHLSGFEMHFFIYGLAIGICSVCSGLACIIKKIFGKYSRALIGS